MSETDGLPRVRDEELDFDSDQVFYHDGLLFTGIAYADGSDGARTEITYRNGVQYGLSREWWPNGQLREDSTYIDGVCHGITRSFSEDGQLTEQKLIEYAILTSKTTYGQDGEVIERWIIGPSDQWFAHLQDERQRFNWPPPIAP